MTPVGWARANMLYDMQTEPPPPGSPLESIFILVWQMRQDAEYHAVRAVVQSSVDAGDDGNALQDAWKGFTEHFYPHLKEEQSRYKQAAMARLKKESERGPLAVRPLAPLIKSKLHKKRRKIIGADDAVMSRLRQRQDRYRGGRPG